LGEAEVVRIGRELLAGPAVKDFSWGEGSLSRIEGEDVRVIEVTYNPGVTDPVAGSVGKAIRDLGIATVRSVKTARKCSLRGDVSEQSLQSICDRLLVNTLIQHVVTKHGNELTRRHGPLSDYQIMVIPGGSLMGLCSRNNIELLPFSVRI